MSGANKINRRQLIKGGAGGALAMGVLAGGASPASADEGRRRRGAIAVHIHGILHGVDPTPAHFTPAVNIDVAGRRSDLAGAGWDSGTTAATGMVPGGTPPAGPVGACYFTAAGGLEGDLVTLKGRSLLTNRPLTNPDSEDPGKSDTRADGRDMNATANLRTGEITFSLSPNGGFFAGTGTVVVFHGGRGSREDDD